MFPLDQILKAAMPLPDLMSFDRFLFIGPHPDDIEIGAGATAARLAAEGKELCFLICTDGRYGTEYLAEEADPETLAGRRREEALAGAACLGVKDVRFLALSDGGFYSEEELLHGMARITGDFQPQVIFAPDPAPINETHPDHIRAGRAAGRLACFANNSGIMARYGALPAPAEALAFYMTARPNRFIGTYGYTARQRKAVACHSSQFEAHSPAFRDLALYLKLRAGFCGLRSLRRRAEGFRVLGHAQMHVLSEFGE